MFSNSTCIILFGIDCSKISLLEKVKEYHKQGLSMIIVSTYNHLVTIELHKYAFVICNDNKGCGTNKIGKIFSNDTFCDNRANAKLIEINRALIIANNIYKRTKYCFIVNVSSTLKTNLKTQIDYELGYQSISINNNKLYASIKIGKNIKYLKNGRKYASIKNINNGSGIINLQCYDNTINSIKTKTKIPDKTQIDLVNYVIAYDSISINDKIYLVRDSSSLFDYSAPFIGFKIIRLVVTYRTLKLILICGKVLTLTLEKDKFPSNASSNASISARLVNSIKYVTESTSESESGSESEYFCSGDANKNRLLNGRIVFPKHNGNWNISSDWCFGSIDDLIKLHNIDYSRSDSDSDFDSIYSKLISDNESPDFMQMSDKYFSYNNNIA